MLRGCKRNEVRSKPVKVSLVDSFVSLVPDIDQQMYQNENDDDSLVEAKVIVIHEPIFLGLPDSVNHVLHCKTKVCLAITSIAERHQGRFCLSDWREGQMGCPILYDDHVACQ